MQGVGDIIGDWCERGVGVSGGVGVRGIGVSRVIGVRGVGVRGGC